MVEYANDVALRVAVGAVAVVILAASIWVSKNRKSELEEDLRKARAAA